VAITFDDGYRDNLTLGVPVLNRLDIPATIFLVPGFLSRRADAWWERLAWGLACAREHAFYLDEARLDLRRSADRNAALGVIEDRLKRLDHRARVEAVEELLKQVKPEGRYPTDELFLDWDGARELTRAGITIGSHTMEHAILARESTGDQWNDLDESRRILQEELKVPVTSLAYPNGAVADYSDATISAAQGAGYEYAFTTTRALVAQDTPPFEVCRWVIDPTLSAARLTAAVLRHFARAEGCGGTELSEYPSDRPSRLS
jgi:peptidoglycan/xylan/chitin deacetylase (PgdA/CDA1 family)